MRYCTSLFGLYSNPLAIQTRAMRRCRMFLPDRFTSDCPCFLQNGKAKNTFILIFIRSQMFFLLIQGFVVSLLLYFHWSSRRIRLAFRSNLAGCFARPMVCMFKVSTLLLDKLLCQRDHQKNHPWKLPVRWSAVP